jgi:hypothetical protein
MKCPECHHDDKLHTDAGCTQEPFCGCRISGERIRFGNEEALISIRKDQAKAWEEVIDHCRALGMKDRHGSSGIEAVLNFITELHEDAKTLREMKRYFRNLKSNKSRGKR